MDMYIYIYIYIDQVPDEKIIPVIVHFFKHQFQRKPKKDEVWQFLRHFDRDRNGQITKEEFMYLSLSLSLSLSLWLCLYMYMSMGLFLQVIIHIYP